MSFIRFFQTSHVAGWGDITDYVKSWTEQQICRYFHIYKWTMNTIKEKKHSFTYTRLEACEVHLIDIYIFNIYVKSV